MKLDLKEWIAKVSTALRNLTTTTEYLSASTSSYASAVGNYTTGTLLTLKPHKKYLLLGTGNSNTGNNIQYYSGFTITSGSGTQVKMYGTPTQPYAGAGGAHNFQGYCETGDTNIGIGVASYKYTTGYTLYWTVYAIELRF